MRVIVVTGAATGIGAACAERLLADEDAVVQVDIQPCQEIAGRAIAVLGDVASPDTWAEVRSRGRDELGPISGLVSNAYTVDIRPAHELSPASWQRQLDVNLTAAFLGFRTLYDDLAAARGSVVGTGSVPRARNRARGRPRSDGSAGRTRSPRRSRSCCRSRRRS